MTSACGSCSCFTDHLRHHSAVLSNADLFILYICVRVFWLGLLPLCMDTSSSFHSSVLFLAYAESQVLVSIFCFSLHRNWDFPCRVWDSCCISPTEVHLLVCRRILSHSYSCGWVWVWVWVLLCSISACSRFLCRVFLANRVYPQPTHTHAHMQRIQWARGSGLHIYFHIHIFRSPHLFGSVSQPDIFFYSLF